MQTTLFIFNLQTRLHVAWV